MAALKGVDLDKHNRQDNADPVEEMKKRVEAKLRGTTVESMELEEIGVAVMEFDE